MKGYHRRSNRLMPEPIWNFTTGEESEPNTVTLGRRTLFPKKKKTSLNHRERERERERENKPGEDSA
jgi:hypothetical protein